MLHNPKWQLNNEWISTQINDYQSYCFWVSKILLWILVQYEQSFKINNKNQLFFVHIDTGFNLLFWLGALQKYFMLNIYFVLCVCFIFQNQVSLDRVTFTVMKPSPTSNPLPKFCQKVLYITLTNMCQRVFDNSNSLSKVVSYSTLHDYSTLQKYNVICP